MSQAVQGELKAGYRPRSAQAQRRSLMLASARPWISAHQGFTTLLLLFLLTLPLVNPWVRGDGVG